jgi:hypothetical protein
MALLGVQGFLRDVLLLGSNAELIYATPYPVPLGFPAGWPVVVAVGLAALGWCGIAAERGSHAARASRWRSWWPARWRRAGVLCRGRTFPKGCCARSTGRCSTSVSTRRRSCSPHSRSCSCAGFGRMPAPWPLERRRLLAAVVFAQYTYVELYPRVDTMHLIVAMPAALVVAAAVTARLSAAGRTPRACARPRCAADSPSPVRRSPSHPSSRSSKAASRCGAAAGFRLPWSRVPVVLENVRATDLRALDATLDYLDARLGPEEALFAFPALGLVPFALGRPTPTPHDYFFPGRPDHGRRGADPGASRRGAAALRVTLNRRLGFFSESPAYYFPPAPPRAHASTGWPRASAATT